MKIQSWPEVQDIILPLAKHLREGLETSIEEKGQKVPIFLLPDGRIIDGHHRWEICGDDVAYKILDMPEMKALELAIELNLEHRQLSNKQIAEIRKKLQKIREAGQEKAFELKQQQQDITQEEIAKEIGVDQGTISRWLNDIPNMQDDDLHIRNIADSRTTIPKKERPEIYDQWIKGETKQKNLAAEYQVTQGAISKICQKEQEKRDREREMEEAAAKIKDESQFTLLQGDMREVCKTLESESFDVIVTDPPYPKEFLPLYGDLAEHAARLLKPGGSLLAMAGQSYLPDIFQLMLPHLNYNWTIAYTTSGGQSPQLWTRKVNTFWKPIVWFVKGEYDDKWVGDVIKSRANDKRFHEWGQSESGMADLVEKLSSKGDHILDPFVGAGTTGVVTVLLNRQFTGIDIKPENIQKARIRIAAAIQGVSNG